MAEMKTLLDHLGILLNQLSDKEKRKLSMDIGRKLRQSQSAGLPNNKIPMAAHTSQEKIRSSGIRKGVLKIKCLTGLKWLGS